MSEQRRLLGFGVTGYRSLSGEDLQYVGPLSKVHLVAGPNNAGKSNILGVAQRLLPLLGTTSDLAMKEVDRPADGADIPHRLRVAIAHELTDDDRNALVAGRGGAVATDIERLFNGPSFTGDGSGLTWFEFEPELDNPGHQTNWRTTERQIRDADAASRARRHMLHSVHDLSSALTGTAGGRELDDLRRVFQHVAETLSLKTQIPPVVTIGAFRQITTQAGHADAGQFDGNGLIERLARLDRPGYADLAGRERYRRVTRFVQTLLDDPEAELLIPQDADDVLVTHDGVTLPLSNYGTGVQQIVILAVAATVLEGHLICIEEPEIHLHPTMQRTLLRYLVEETDNQYLIATHSAHLLDAGRASITAVRRANARTVTAAAVTPTEVADVSARLGFRASDLVQSNAVIWVEGPSDRTYLRHWLSLVAPDLLDGVHFSLMFYGGSLLNHLSPDDPGVDEFVALPRINRNFAVVIDSDRTHARKPINATKKRVRSGIEGAGPRTVVWVTSGYTIENYVPPDVLKEGVEAAHPGTTCLWAGARYENPLGPAHVSGARTTVDKPAVAREVVQRWPEGQLPRGLRDRVNEIVSMLRAANRG